MKTEKNDKRGAECERRVYGVYGLTEWQALIPAGQATVRINFSGGHMSAYGIVPATFATVDPAVQRLIEESGYYARRRIRLIRKERVK